MMESTNIHVCLYVKNLTLAMLVPKSVGRMENSIKCKAIDQNNAIPCAH